MCLLNHPTEHPDSATQLRGLMLLCVTVADRPCGSLLLTWEMLNPQISSPGEDHSSNSAVVSTEHTLLPVVDHKIMENQKTHILSTAAIGSYLDQTTKRLIQNDSEEEIHRLLWHCKGASYILTKPVLHQGQSTVQGMS